MIRPVIRSVIRSVVNPPTGFGSSFNWKSFWTEKINNGLIGYWKLNELTGNAIDSLGTYNGINVSVTQGVEGKIGTGYSFVRDSTKSHVYCGAISLDTYSVGGWVKRGTVPGNSCIIGIGGRYSGLYYGINGTGFILMNAAGTNLATWPNVQEVTGNNDWHHIFLTVTKAGESNTVNLYVDGKPILEKTITAEAISNLVIGDNYWDGTFGSSWSLPGSICDFGLWNRILDINEIAALINQYSGNTYPFISYTKNLSQKSGNIIFTFDDGLASIYGKVYPLFLSKGAKGTFFIIHNKVGTVGYVTWAQLQEMNVAGMELGGHGDTQFSTLSEAQLRTYLDAADAAFILNSLPPPLTGAYPYSNDQEWVEIVCADYYSLERGTNSSYTLYPYANPIVNPFDVPEMNAGTTDIAVLKAIIDGLFARNSTTVFMLHNIVDSAPAAGERTLSWLTELVDYCNTRRVNFITFAELLPLLG